MELFTSSLLKSFYSIDDLPDLPPSERNIINDARDLILLSAARDNGHLILPSYRLLGHRENSQVIPCGTLSLFRLLSTIFNKTSTDETVIQPVSIYLKGKIDVGRPDYWLVLYVDIKRKAVEILDLNVTDEVAKMIQPSVEYLCSQLIENGLKIDNPLDFLPGINDKRVHPLINHLYSLMRLVDNSFIGLDAGLIELDLRSLLLNPKEFKSTLLKSYHWMLNYLIETPGLLTMVLERNKVRQIRDKLFEEFIGSVNNSKVWTPMDTALLEMGQKEILITEKLYVEINTECHSLNVESFHEKTNHYFHSSDHALSLIQLLNNN